ncbi:MAG TPA: purine-nucleoside phosphorylase [Aggregatilineales bacterium]|nr:purine-nucleoside phosphorylase [Aggregatilineales bacterium]
MIQQYTADDYAEAVKAIRSMTDLTPRIGLVLGSGLGGLADAVESPVVIPYGDIPGWPRSTVHGHSGRLVIGHLEGVPVLVQQGRAHFYEGYTPQQITFPIRVMHHLGIKTLILTNAAGGVNKAYAAGDIMMLNDHINFVGMSGNNPLMGPNDDSLGPRFLGMSQTYDRELRQRAQAVARDAGIALHEGVYVCLSGPTFETPAEIRMMRAIGGDAVGMSTVHEVLVARHANMRVLAFSSITNVGIDAVDTTQDTNHDEVLEVGKVIVPRLTQLLRGVIKSL